MHSGLQIVGFVYDLMEINFPCRTLQGKSFVKDITGYVLVNEGR